jgi:glutaredoxin
MGDFVVYSKPACVQCDQAKALIKAKGKTYIEKQIDVGQDKKPDADYVELQVLKQKYPNIRMAPVITDIDGNFIGSLPELRKLLS